MSDEMLTKLSNSSAASKKIVLLEMSEPFCSSEKGVFVGRTRLYRTPFLLDHDALLNRHMAIVGMTGSGKTYFMRSHLIRCVLVEGYSLLIIDWNGEYDETVDFLHGRIVRPVQFSESGIKDAVALDGVTSISLSGITDDAERRKAADFAIRCALGALHLAGIDQNAKRLIVLDEAWRMLHDTGALGQLFREGRKYGVGVCIATQLVGDIENEAIANCACLAVFRLQNPSDYLSLIGAGVITTEQAGAISSLRIGECMLHLAYKEGNRVRRFFIGKVIGIPNKRLLSKGDKMIHEMSEHRLSSALNEMVEDQSARTKIMDYINANGWRVGAVQLIRVMASAGLQRKDVVPLLRQLGIDDLTTIKAYESAKGAMLELDK